PQQGRPSPPPGRGADERPLPRHAGGPRADRGPGREALGVHPLPPRDGRKEPGGGAGPHRGAAPVGSGPQARPRRADAPLPGRAPAHPRGGDRPGRDAAARPAGGSARHLRRARRGGAGLASSGAPLRPRPERRAARRTLRRRTRPDLTKEHAMNFELTEEQIALRDAARKFAREVIAPAAAKYDRTGEFPYEVISKGFELGLMNLTVPAEYGGLGLSKVDQVLVVEELAAGCVGIATSMGANDLALLPILIGGTPEQKERFVRPFTEKLRFASFCLTEPGAGSDAAGLSTTAVRDGDHYVLNGTKMWI